MELDLGAECRVSGGARWVAFWVGMSVAGMVRFEFATCLKINLKFKLVPSPAALQQRPPYPLPGKSVLLENKV